MSDENFNIDEAKNFFQPANLKAFFQPNNLKAFVARAWNGELPLWQAFWGLGVLVNIILNIFIKLVSVIIPIPGFIVLFAIVMLILQLPLIALQAVAVWRSALNYNAANPSVYWGYAAQALVALGVIFTVLGLVGVAFHH